MDITTLFKISYGLYIIGAKDSADKTGGGAVGGTGGGTGFAGCVVNTVTQATSKPVTLTVCINKDNYTNACIKESGEFSVSIVSESMKPETIGIFGFSSSRDRDKFAEVPHGLTPSGLPYVKDGATGFIQCKVIDFVDNYTHTIFIAEVTEAENLSKDPPMTYSYYRTVIKGTSPKNAPTYVAADPPANVAAEKPAAQAEPAAQAAPVAQVGPVAPASPAARAAVYKCSVCGYEYPGGKEEFEQLPDNYVCPICGAAKGKFTLILV